MSINSKASNLPYHHTVYTGELKKSWSSDNNKLFDSFGGSAFIAAIAHDSSTKYTIALHAVAHCDGIN